MENPTVKQMIVNAAIGAIGFSVVMSAIIAMFVPIAVKIAASIYGVEVDIF